MTDLAARTSETTATARETARNCLCESFARSTERAALASARWLGRADEAAAQEAASSGMLEALQQLPIDGTIVNRPSDPELRPSECASLFLAAIRLRDAGAVCGQAGGGRGPLRGDDAHRATQGSGGGPWAARPPAW